MQWITKGNYEISSKLKTLSWGSILVMYEMDITWKQ